MQRLNEKMINDIFQWDVRSWSKALSFWEEKIEWRKINECLELGAKKGGLSLWLALKGKNVVCSDLQNPFAAASALHSNYNVSIEYKAVDALNLPYENHFDLIVIKSILGGIGRNNNKQLQQKVINEIYKALKPDGVFLFAENLSSTRLHQFLKRRFVSWGEYWRYISLTEMKEFLIDFSSYQLKTTGFIAPFGRSEWQRNFLAILDQIVFNQIVKESSRCVVYGIAKK